MEHLKKKRGRKPIINSDSGTGAPKEEGSVSPVPNKKKKRGRKKKCEMNLENTDKMKDFITYFDTTENNELRFDTLNSAEIDTKDADEAKGAEDTEGAEGTENVEEIRFGGIVIKKHKTSQPNTSELHRNFIRKNNENGKNNVELPSNSICEINLDNINDNSDSDSDDNSENPRKGKGSPKPFGTRFKTKKKVGVSDLIQVNNETIDKEIITRTKINKRNADYNYLETTTIMKHYGDCINEWPQKTNVLCWWCCHPFEKPPAFIPTKFDSINKRYKITGNFCTWNCAKSYLFGEKSFQNRQSKHLFTSLLLYLKIPYNIKPAPPRLTLKTFGGPLSIEEFREHSLYRETGIFKINTIKMKLDDECKIKHYF